MLYVVGDTTMS